jgi:hypothetical protein
MHDFFKSHFKIAMLFCVTVLAACVSDAPGVQGAATGDRDGGLLPDHDGGADSPIVSASAVATPARVFAGGLVTVDAKGSTSSRADKLAYAWKLAKTPAGASASFADPAAVTTTIVPTVPGEYTVEVTVTAPGAAPVTASASVVVDATPREVRFAQLGLWLTADKDLSCTSSDVTAWNDQSALHNNATPVAGHPGPRCTGTLKGTTVPFFPAPPTDPPYVDGTLSVDLGFLSNSDYTIFAVARRARDVSPGSLGWSSILGTFPTGNGNCDGADSSVNTSLTFGFGGSTSFVVGHYCSDLVATIPAFTNPVAQRFTAKMQKGAGRWLFIDGTQAKFDATQGVSLTLARGGTIGHSGFNAGGGDDKRFQGDIAEVVIYSAALSDADRETIESYLKKHWGL